MQKVELNLESLAELDSGKIQACFAAELKRAVADCVNRPSNKKNRTVNLLLTMTPKMNENDGSCEGIKVAFDVKSNVPARSTNAYDMGVTQAGQAWFTSDEEATVD